MLDFPPIYATRLTRGLISVKLKEHRILEKTVSISSNRAIKSRLGECLAEFFRVNHSIPDAIGIVLHTPVGTVVHTGDYKFDYTPVDGKPADLGALWADWQRRCAGDDG